MNDYVATILIQGKDKASPAITKVGGSLVNLGTGIDKITPKMEQAATAIGLTSTAAGLLASVLPPVAASVAVTGKQIATITDATANYGDATAHMMKEVGGAMQDNEDIARTWVTNIDDFFRRLIGLEKIPETLGGKIAMLGKIIGKTATFFGAWGEHIDVVYEKMWYFIETGMKMDRMMGGLQKAAFGSAQGFGEMTAHLSQAEQKITLTQRAAQLLIKIWYSLATAVTAISIPLGDLVTIMTKLSPVATLLGIKLESLGRALESTGEEVQEIDGSFRSLRKGINPHLAESFRRITRALEDLARAAKTKAQKALKELKEAFANLGKKATEVFEGMKARVKSWAASLRDALGNIMRNLAFIGLALAAISPALGKITKLFEDFMPGAARLQGINAAFLAIAGEGAPAMERALRAGSGGMVEWIDLAGRYVDATLLINKQVADRLPDALIYLTKISLATGESMDYLLDSLVRGVGRLSPRILDNLKIQVSLAEATDYAAQIYGKEADALSVTEKQMGMMAVTMTRLEAKTSELADTTGTVMALMAQYKVLQAENAKLLASIFLPVAKSWYKLQLKIAQAFRKSISEGGRYYNTLRKISAAVSVLIDWLGELVDRFSGAGTDAVDTFADKMFEAAWKAFSWGANIVNNLAIGITRGAASALLAAMNFISNLLSHWLAPGSAPRIAPHILAWGAATFTEFLRGFVEADFDILTGVQAPLQAALQNLVALGEISKEDAGNIFINLSEAMAEAIATGDYGAALSQLAAVGGEYGAELEELFRRQLAVAEATGAMADAEQRLAAARAQEGQAGKQLSKQAREYNRMLKEGASAEALRAKLAEMQASYSTLEDAREEAELAEEDREAAQDRAREANRLMGLQADLLQQLIRMGQVQAQIAEDAGDIVDPEQIIPPFEGLINNIDQAFEDLKGRIRARFLALWAELREDWNNSGVGKLIEDLKKKWEDSTLKEWWDEFLFDVREEGIREALKKLWLKLEVAVQNWLDDKAPWAGEVWRAFTQGGIEDGTGAVDFGAALDALWLEFEKGVGKRLAGTWLGDVWRDFTQEGIEDGTGKVDFGAAFATLWSKLLKGINNWIGTGSWEHKHDYDARFKKFTEEGAEEGAEAVTLGAVLETLWTKFKQLLLDLATRFGAYLSSTIYKKLAGDGGEEGQTFWESLGQSFINGIIAGFSARMWEKHPHLMGLAATLYGFFTSFFGSQSPSTLFKGLGKDLMQGLWEGLWNKVYSYTWYDAGAHIRNNIIWGFMGIADGVKGAMNDVINVIEWTINRAIDGLNALIGGINAIPGTWVNYLNHVTLPRLGRGGLVMGAEQLALLHGPEIVLPLNDPYTTAMLSDVMREAGDQGGQGDIVIHNYFGQGSVRSNKDIRAIADAIDHSFRLSGVKGPM